MSRKPLDPEAARLAWDALTRAGGLVSNADLRAAWGTKAAPLTRQSVQALTSRKDFPPPVIRGGRGIPDHWLAADVEQWRRTYETTTRRGPKTRQTSTEQ